MNTITEILSNYVSWLETFGFDFKSAVFLKEISVLLLIFLLIWLFDFILRKIVLRLIAVAAQKTATEWDDVLIENRVIKRILHIVPAFVFHKSIPNIFSETKTLVNFLESGIEIYAILMIMLTFSALFKSVNQMYLKHPLSKERSIKGYLQVGSIIVYFIGGIAIVSVLIGQSILVLLGGLGAFAAVLMLVFKDSILGLVSGIQLSSNDMLRPGDWITMPSHAADGVVTEIGLTIVKVQNFDKTIVTIPTYTLVSNSFQNWRGMINAGTRRIKRFIYIDLNSVKFCDDDFQQKIKSNILINNYLQTDLIDFQYKTNIEIFRMYAIEFIKKFPAINQENTPSAKVLQPNEFGIPFEFVAFSNITSPVEYENIQNSITEHFIAILSTFDLKVFQTLNSSDLKLK